MKPTNPLQGSLVITAARIVASLCGFALNWLVARRSADDLGAFRTLLVFFLVAETLPLLGLQILLVRDVALNRAQVKRYLLHAVIIAESVSLAMVFGIGLLSYWGNYSPMVSKGLLLIAFALPASAGYVCAAPVLVALGRTTEFGLIQTLETIGRAALGAIFLSLGWPTLWVIASFVILRWIAVGFYGRLLLREARDISPWKFDPSFLRSLLQHAPVFAAIAGCVAISRYATPLALAWIAGDQAAGHFGAAYLFIDIVLLLPTALVLNLLPRFAVIAKQSADNLTQAASRSIKLMALGVLPVIGGITVIASGLLQLIFRHHEFSSSVLILQVVIWSCLPLALDQILSAAIVASGKQLVDLQVVSLGAGVLIVILYPLVKSQDALGAAWAFLIGAWALVAIRFIFVRRHLGQLNPVALFWRPVVATAAMMGTLLALPPLLLPVTILIGAVVYTGALLALGTFKNAERAEIFGWLGTEKAS